MPDAPEEEITMDPLEFYARVEAQGWNCAADEEMLPLERDGLVIIEDVGWGMRKVRLTAKGNAVLSATVDAFNPPARPNSRRKKNA